MAHWKGTYNIGSKSFLITREKEILKLIIDENKSSEIAYKLFISSRTVEGHCKRLLIKVGAKNTVGLAILPLGPVEG